MSEMRVRHCGFIKVTRVPESIRNNEKAKILLAVAHIDQISKTEDGLVKIVFGNKAIVVTDNIDDLLNAWPRRV